MKPTTYQRVVALSIGIAALSGTAIHRVVSDWQALVYDVGSGGAWIVTFCYYSVYGATVGVGAILSASILKLFNGKLYKTSVGSAAVLSIGITEWYITSHVSRNVTFWSIAGVLLSSSCLLNTLLSPDLWDGIRKRKESDGKQEQWIVGPEYDERLFVTLGASLRALGYDINSEWWGVGGSQENSTWRVKGPRGCLTIEAETYIGLSVNGDKDLVDEVKKHFASHAGNTDVT